MLAMSLPSRAQLEALAVRAGALALGFQGRVRPEQKPDRTLVSEADRAVEALIVQELESVFPEAAILGEEGSVRPGRGPYRVVIDPIDGTSAFLAGLPTWCVSIGVLEAGRPIAGVVHVPSTAETYSATGGAAFRNGERLGPLAGASAGGEPYVLIPAKAHLRSGIRWPGKARSLGSAAHHVVLVARGSAEAALLEPAYVWDLAGAAPILAAVGGVLCYASGRPVELEALAEGGRAPEEIVAAAAGRIDEFLGQLARRT